MCVHMITCPCDMTNPIPYKPCEVNLSDRTFRCMCYLISQGTGNAASSRSKPFVPFHGLSPSPQSAIHFQSHDPVIVNGLLYTETCICGFPSTDRDMCRSDCCKELELETEMFAKTKKKKKFVFSRFHSLNTFSITL